MKHRHVFQTGNLAQANQAIEAAVRSGIPDDHIYLVARPDIELRRVRNRRQMADSDFIPAAMRGALVGGGIGLVLLLLFALNRDFAWTWILLVVGLGAAMGALSASLIGATIPDPIRRKFAEQIDHGSILVVLDAEERECAAMASAMKGVGATRMPYEFPSALT